MDLCTYGSFNYFSTSKYCQKTLCREERGISNPIVAPQLALNPYNISLFIYNRSHLAKVLLYGPCTTGCFNYFSTSKYCQRTISREETRISKTIVAPQFLLDPDNFSLFISSRSHLAKFLIYGPCTSGSFNYLPTSKYCQGNISREEQLISNPTIATQ